MKHSQDIRDIQKYIDHAIGSGKYSPSDAARMGGAAALMEHLKADSLGEACRARKELKDSVAYLHMYETTHNPIYLEFAQDELKHAEAWYERMSDSDEKEKFRPWVKRVESELEAQRNIGAAPEGVEPTPKKYFGGTQ